jgi:hypothetical protein
MDMANLGAPLRRGLALLTTPAEYLAPPVIGIPRLRPLGASLSVFRAVSVFQHHVFQFRRLPILALLAILLLPYPTPHGLDYDSKGVTPFDPRNSALNRPPIPSNWP